MAEHRRHHRHLNRNQFGREPVTHVYGGLGYLAPWDLGFYTAQAPHGAAGCPDPTGCAAHAGDPSAGAGAVAGDPSAGATAGDAGGTV